MFLLGKLVKEGSSLRLKNSLSQAERDLLGVSAASGGLGSAVPGETFLGNLLPRLFHQPRAGLPWGSEQGKGRRDRDFGVFPHPLLPAVPSSGSDTELGRGCQDRGVP